MDNEQIIEKLNQDGFDVGLALEVCVGDEDLYMEILETALEEGKRKLPVISECIEDKDYERYHIEVHGLKNAMRSIGAMRLSELSFMQEKAAEAGDYKCVDADCTALIQEYQRIMKLLKALLNR